MCSLVVTCMVNIPFKNGMPEFHARIVAILSQIEFVHSLSSDKRLQWFQDMDYCCENLYMSLPPT